MKPHPRIRALRNKLARATALIAQLRNDKIAIIESAAKEIEWMHERLHAEKRETDRNKAIIRYMNLQKAPAEKRDAPQWVKLGMDGRPL